MCARLTACVIVLGFRAEVSEHEIPGVGAEAVPTAARLERGVHGRHQLVQSHSDDGQLPADAPASRGAAAWLQPWRAAHRVLRAVRQEIQLLQHGHPRARRRWVRAARGGHSQHGQRLQVVVAALHRRPAHARLEFCFGAVNCVIFLHCLCALQRTTWVARHTA